MTALQHNLSTRRLRRCYAALLLGLLIVVMPARAEEKDGDSGGGFFGSLLRMPVQSLSAESSEAPKQEAAKPPAGEERWQDISREEQNELRRDIRNAGREIYRRPQQNKP